MNSSRRPLHTLATVRAGDKGDTSLLAVHPHRSTNAAWLRAQLTESAISAHFGMLPENVQIHPPTASGVIVIALRGRLDGGVTRSTSTDPHGKTLSFHLLELTV